jgi:hypothetical protein
MLTPLSLTPPTAHTPTLSAVLLPSAHLSPSTTLSFSFHHGTQEVHSERLTQREMQVNNDGSVIATVGSVPKFKGGVGVITRVKVYEWKGEKLVGEWDVGSY